MYLITNGQIVRENGILINHDLLLVGDKIKNIRPRGEIEISDSIEIIDAKGGFVSPGFVDIHSDFIETMAVPRPTSMIDFNLCLRESEKILINQGITTMFHSLSLYKPDGFSHKPIRSSKNVKKMVDLISKTHESNHLIRHRFHARLEIDNFEEIENIKGYIEENKVHLISFMDHTPGQGQYKDLEVYRNTIKGYKDVSDNEVNNIIEKHQGKEKMTLELIKEIADFARSKNINVASHDDDCNERLNLVKSFGASISEFPITLEVAKCAKSIGMLTIAGAPNILQGGSHSGNLSAIDAINNDLIDILCSDYYPAALLHSIFIMHEEHGQDLGKMFNLVTINPAKAVNMDNEIGSIEENKKADIIIIEKIDKNYPVITSVFVDGNLVSSMNYRI
ncbi:phosphonate metabolism protein PhnM [Clostridium lacusfryxellense]|uniref:phosphonate metabolism protein PhnM n=1 Tax=Clostridium lacusfryxellense TaxID=205328 RepID=UPI001C0A953E|nr:phosphonate metabolism protein PhnM [Clostridium lacusfryxellense]MBU3112530.1 phosphonate metabolism protein PhnM [Clostridium lacusfryxellense]